MTNVWAYFASRKQITMLYENFSDYYLLHDYMHKQCHVAERERKSGQ